MRAPSKFVLRHLPEHRRRASQDSHARSAAVSWRRLSLLFHELQPYRGFPSHPASHQAHRCDSRSFSFSASCPQLTAPGRRDERIQRECLHSYSKLLNPDYNSVHHANLDFAIMELVVLGSGTSIPHPECSSSVYWLRASGGTVLLDCSASAIWRILEEGLNWTDLDAIWISHFHLDHCGGLAPLLAGIKHSDEMKQR